MRTYVSTYIKKADMLKDIKGEELEKAKADIAQLETDIQMFSSRVRKITNDLTKPRPEGKESIHVEYAHKFGLLSYHVTNLERAGKGITEAARELLKLNIENQKDKISQMEDKIKTLEEQIKNANKIKDSLIERSKAKKEIECNANDSKKRHLPTVKNCIHNGIKCFYNKDDTVRFEVSRGRKTKKNNGVLVFENEYLFEVLYLDPYIRKKKQTIRQIQGRLHNTKRKLEKLERDLKDKKYHICFGGKKLSRQRNKPKTQTYHWKNKFEKKRLREMLLVGRYDGGQGNWLVKYDVDSNSLTYYSTKKTYIVLPNVLFPYGQENVINAVSISDIIEQNKKLPSDQQIPHWDKMPVTWSIKDCGNAFQVKCMINVPKNKHMNSFYDEGCIGVDKNYDHFAVSEVNKYGQLVKSFAVPFKVTNKTSNQRTNNISEALEDMFKFALGVGKPIVVENIQDVKTNTLYGNKKANRKISQFAYDKMDALIENKSQKYGICVRKVNPAYTSQIGKLKYMKQTGLSVHEAAAYTIARRGMGFKERVPNQLRHFLPKNKRKVHHWAQWNKISSTLKTIPTHLFYNKKISYVDFKTLTKLKNTLMGGLAS